jgi:hypothetical protein
VSRRKETAKSDNVRDNLFRNLPATQTNPVHGNMNPAHTRRTGIPGRKVDPTKSTTVRSRDHDANSQNSLESSGPDPLLSQEELTLYASFQQ